MPPVMLSLQPKPRPSPRAGPVAKIGFAQKQRARYPPWPFAALVDYALIDRSEHKQDPRVDLPTRGALQWLLANGMTHTAARQDAATKD